MDFDPVNNSNRPPSRYLLESDSESEREDEPQVSDQASRNLQDRIKILFQDTDNKSVDQIKDRDLNILLGQAGISWSQSVGSGGSKEDASLLVDGIQQASISFPQSSNDPLTILIYPTVSILSFNEIQAPSSRIIFETLKPKSVTLFTSYSPHLYIQSQSEKDETFQKERQRDESGFPPLRFLLSGKNCQTLKKTLLSDSNSDTDLKVHQSPNVLTGLAGVVASQATFLSLPLLILLFPESISQPHSHHHSHAYLPSSASNSTSRPPFNTTKLEQRLLIATQKVLKIAGRSNALAASEVGDKKTLNGFLFDRRVGTMGVDGEGEGGKVDKKENNDSMYL